MRKKPNLRRGFKSPLSGALTSVVVHPIIGKLVEAGGDALVGEFLAD